MLWTPYVDITMQQIADEDVGTLLKQNRPATVTQNPT